MSSPSPSVAVSHKYEVRVPQTEHAILVPISFWNRLRGRVEKCGDSLEWHWAILWVAIGIAPSAGLSAVLFWASVSFTITNDKSELHPNWSAIVAFVTCIALTAVSLGVALCSFIYCRKSLYHGETLRRMIVDDMDCFGPSVDGPGSPSRTDEGKRGRTTISPFGNWIKPTGNA